MAKFQKKKPKGSKDYMDNTEYHEQGQPKEDQHISTYINDKALKNLPKSSYSLQADPYEAALPASKPYNLIAPFNRPVGGNFKGEHNIDGGNVQQYANSVRSKFLNVFDFMKLKISLNYRYTPSRLAQLPTDEGPDEPYLGSGLVDQARQAIAESTSVLGSTTFTDMAIYEYCVETDMPMGSAKRTKHTITPAEGDPFDIYTYDNVCDVIYATSRYYQTFLQDALNTFNAHNSFRLKMGTAIRSSYNRETPQLNDLFSLFKKKSWTQLMDGIGNSFTGEWVDTEWMKQMNALSILPSRRSNSITDPVLELQTRMIHPGTFKLWIKDSTGNIVSVDGKPFFDDAVDMVKPCYNGSQINQVSFWDAIDDLNDYFSIEHAVQWARSDEAARLEVEPSNTYFNFCKSRLDVLTSCFGTFKSQLQDIREVFETCNRAGIVYWVKGFRPSVCKDTDATISENLTVEAIYKMVFSGAPSIIQNVDTKRWRTFTLWNMYKGIPEYDAMSGGAFLTFSGKNIDTDDVDDQTYMYVPQMFVADQSILSPTDTGVVVRCVNRKGLTAYIKAEEVVGSTNESLCRLFPLTSQNSYKIRIPVVYHNAPAADSVSVTSGLIKTVTQVFGFGKIGTNGNIYVEPDLLSVYDIEIDDITNDAIAYARVNAPFVGATTMESSLGFDTFGVEKKSEDKK